MTLLSVISEQCKCMSEKERITCIQMYTNMYTINPLWLSLMIFLILTCMIRDSLHFFVVKYIIVKDLILLLGRLQPMYASLSFSYSYQKLLSSFLKRFCQFLQNAACVAFCTFLYFSLEFAFFFSNTPQTSNKTGSEFLFTIQFLHSALEEMKIWPYESTPMRDIAMLHILWCLENIE